MHCPKCTLDQPDAADCARCGLIIAKWKPAAPPPLPIPAREPAPTAESGVSSRFGVTERAPENGAAPLLYGCGALAVLLAGLIYGLARNWPALSRRWAAEQPATAPASPATPPRPKAVPLFRPATVHSPAPRQFPPVPAAARPVPGAPPLSSFEMLLDATPLPPPPDGSLAAGWREGAAGYSEAVRDHDQADTPLLIFFYTDWCPHCKAVQEKLWADPRVETALRAVVRVRINPENGDADNTIYRHFGVRGIPTCFFVPPRAAEATEFPCYDGMTTQEFIETLEYESHGRVDHLVHEGALKTRRKENRGAIELFDQALTLNPREREAYLWRGMTHAQSGEPFAAQADLLRAIKLDPHQIDGYRELHEVWLQGKRYDDMIAAWDYFLRLEPRNGWAWLERSGTWRFKGDTARALEDARKSCELGEAQGCRVAALLR